MILVFSCSCFDIYFCCWALCKNFCTKSFVPLLVATTLTAAPTGRRIFDRTAETLSIKFQSPQYSFHRDLISSFPVMIAVSLITYICSWKFSILEFISLNISCELLHGATLSSDILLRVLLVTLCYQDPHWYQPCWRGRYFINIGK